MAGTEPLRNKLVLVDQGSGLIGFADWAEQLIAESTGKQGTGVLPVVVPDDSAPEVALPAARRHRGAPRRRRGRPPTSRRPTTTTGPAATSRSPARWAPRCCCGRSRPPPPAGSSGINPFDQPDVESAKTRPARCSRAARTARPPRSPTARSRSAPSVATGSATPPPSRTRSPRCSAQVDGEQGYVAVMAYLDRLDQADARRGAQHRSPTGYRRPVTFGWGPRFLHSTGQFHKGGPAEGVYLQITAEPTEDLAVPGKDVHLRPADRLAVRRRRAACSPTTAAPCSGCT